MSGLLNNGDFETTTSDGFPSTGVGEGQISLLGWNSNGTIETVEMGQKQGDMILVVPQGLLDFFFLKLSKININNQNGRCLQTGKAILKS